MANTIKLKRASGSDPGNSDLSVGELAIRTSNCKLFSKNDGGSAVGIVAGSADTLTTARTIAGVSFDGSANISLNNNAITNGAGYITATLTNEQVQDIVGGMVTGNTETGITVTYQDGDGTLDFVVGTLNQDTTGNAATATALETARTIAGVSFDGTANISLNNNAITNGAGYITATLTNEEVQDIVGGMLTGNTETGITVTYQDGDGTIDFVVGTLNQDTTGNAATATALETARNIGGVSFDGTGNINLPGVNTSGNQDTSGNAATATALATARTIAGVSFDGTANISLNNNAITNGAGYITATLTNEQVQDIVGAMVSSNTETGITVTYQDADGTLDFVVASQTDNNFTDADHSKLDGIAAGANVGIAASGGEFTGNITTHDVVPDGNNTRDLGSSSARFANLFVNDMHFANSPENVNKVDGTWGDWTLQEGEDSIFMLNNRNGKKYKINLTEIV